MDPSIDISLDEELRLALKARFAPEAVEHIHLKIVSEGSGGLVYVELQLADEPAPRRMTLGEALSKTDDAAQRSMSAKLRGRRIPDAVLALSGVVPGAGDAELEYRLRAVPSRAAYAKTEVAKTPTTSRQAVKNRKR